MTGPRARAHPTVQNGSFVQVHVMVGYDAYGPGPHLCHWCKTPVDWLLRLESWTSVDGVKKIIVDHLDRDTLNFAVANLVLSCVSCNTSRHADTYEQPSPDALLDPRVRVLTLALP